MNRRSFIQAISAAAAFLAVPFRKLLPTVEAPAATAATIASDYIKIGSLPRIVEDTDRWGMPMGTYSVHGGAGYVLKTKWQELYEFENHDACGGREETENAAKQLAAGATVNDLDLPLMRKRIKTSLVEQFNMSIHDPSTLPPDVDTEYIRMVAFFNERTLVEWKPEHDEMMSRLQAQCDRMNAESTGRS